MEKENHNKIIERMIRDRKFRVAVTRESHYWFFHFYFRHYVTSRTAEFQKRMFQITEDENINLAAVVAFRGSGKSSIFTLSYALWSILGKQQKKFAIILSQTQRQAKQHLINIKTELEQNRLLRNDLGPFREESDEWGGYALVITNYGARITAASSEQSIRGLRHLQNRPDVIVCDDVEDLQSTKTKEGRDRTYNWFKGDIIPAGTTNTKIIVVGNLLHEDSLLKRIQQEIEEKKLNGIYEEFPLIDRKEKALWPDRFPGKKEIEKERKKIGNEITWQREYLLKIVSDSGRVIHHEWLHYYDFEKELPDEKDLLITYVGIDLAISEKNNAHRTAILSAKIYQDGERKKAYIMPHPFNDTVGFPEQINQVKLLLQKPGYECPKIFVEKVYYQEALIQQLNNAGIEVEGIVPHGDKRERLSLTTATIKEGLVLFPKQGAEELIFQLIGFGVEKYDDLADAFSLLSNQFIAYCNEPIPGITWINIGRPRQEWPDDDDDF